jgi:acyl-CoA reductase-like NAD-dependent aldehyde dehydrogenase
VFNGAVIDEMAIDAMLNAIEKAGKQGGKLIYGGALNVRWNEGGHYISPAIMEVRLIAQ